MTPQEFASIIRTEVLEDNLAIYRQMLAEHKEAKDPYWQKLRMLNNEQQQVLQMVMRQVAVDTIASLLGVLDGVVILKNHREDFSLTYGSDPKKLNGDLHDYFLAAEA